MRVVSIVAWVGASLMLFGCEKPAPKRREPQGVLQDYIKKPIRQAEEVGSQLAERERKMREAAGEGARKP